MAAGGPPEGGNPFEGMPLFRDLQGLFAAQGPVNWDIARQVGVWTAAEGVAEPNVDPLIRIRFEELARVAELHVADATGLATSVAGTHVSVQPVTRAEWAAAALDAYRPLLERLAGGLAAAGLGGVGVVEDDDVTGGPDPLAGFLGNISQVMGPVLVGLQSGFMAGHLARRALGQYDLPIPRPPSDALLVVAATVDRFATDWSLPLDDVRLWVCLNEITHHAVLGRPHVRERLEHLLGEYAGGFEPDSSSFEARLGDLDPTDPASFQSVLGDPEAILGAMQSDAQRALLQHIGALVAAIEGYTDHVMDVVGRKLIGSYPALTEALRRRRVERGDGDKFVERLFGVELAQAQYDRGQAFVRGVLERAGDNGLNRLWHSADELPTPAEVDAPGLWLARIDLPTS
ncbi:MAG: zinc-dependent metalloprotease [Actinobacteria bacterium]|nr:zinc-dependent metalloprotease [Actinomycetota bacterium]